MNALYKILAWRFTPEENEMVVKTEYNRVVERMLILLKRDQAQGGQKAPDEPVSPRERSTSNESEKNIPETPLEQKMDEAIEATTNLTLTDQVKAEGWNEEEF